MEFLDPVAKKKHRRQLFLGYGLVAILIALATYILVATAVGYEVFSTGGNVVQNGLVFMGSEPVSASILVDGKLEDDRTEAKLPLAAGQYSISLEQPSYTPWTKKVNVEGGKVRFITYPLLFPVELTPKDLAAFSANVGFATQSPNSRWLVVQQNSSLPAVEIFDLESPEQPPTSAVFSSEILINTEGDFGSFEIVQWSSDNRHFLLQQVLPDGRQAFLLIDRQNIDQSINLGNTFGVEPTSVTLFDEKANKFYMYFEVSGLLRIADLDSRTVATPILDQVLTYQTRGSNLILYTTTKDAETGKVAVKIFSGGSSYPLTSVVFDPTNKYFLDFNNFEGSWYYAVGSGQSDRVMIYRNPLNFIAAKTPKKASVLTTLRAGKPDDMSFSVKESRFIFVRSGLAAAVYDAEEDTSYRYDIPFQIDTGSEMTWFDDFHLQAVSEGKLRSIEFDGENTHQFLPVSGAKPGFFSKDMRSLFTISPGTDSAVLQFSGLIAAKVKTH